MNGKPVAIVGLGNLGLMFYLLFVMLGIPVLVNNGTLERTRQKLLEKGGDPSHAATLEQIARKCIFVFLCVKPYVFEEIAPELSRVLREHHYVFSCIALLTLQEVEYLLQKANPIVVKVMPTLGVFNGKSITAYQLPYFASYQICESVQQVLAIISAPKEVHELYTEMQMQRFTEFVACMPGIIAHFVNQFTWRLVKEDPEVFGWYPDSLPTLLRSIADLLEKAGTPLKLWEQVATKGGVTRAMTDVLGMGGLSSLIEEAIEAGLQRMKDAKK